MDNDSLMNPEFLHEEITSLTRLFDERESSNTVTRKKIDRILDAFHDAEKTAGSFDNMKLTPELHHDIIVLLSAYRQETYYNPFRVQLRQLRQLLRDRRYRIITRITAIFK